MKLILILSVMLIYTSVLSQPFYIAHRGASYDAPENTLASAKLAWEMGADAVECDIYLTKDNQVMVIHDKDTKRTSPNSQNLGIKESESSELRKLDMGTWKNPAFAGEKIPFLAELIQTVPENKILVVEIKCGVEALPFLKTVVDESKKQEQIVFISFGWETIVETHKMFPQNKCYWLSSVKLGLGQKINEAANAGLSGVNLHYSVIDTEIVEKAKNKNLEVLAWTVDNPDEAKRLVLAGVTKITTNRPQWLRKEFEK